MAYPNTIDSFANPSGTQTLDNPCIICGKLFHNSHKRVKCCSRRCGDISRRGGVTSKRGKVETSILVKCEICNKEYYNYLSYIKKGRKRFCSIKCSAKHLAVINKGSNAPNWKGGITKPDKQLRREFMQSIRKQVLERDNYTCQLCGARNGLGKDVKLQVDHIQSWAEYVELRFEMSNCRTLCMDCHYQITFGKPKPKNIKNWGINFKKGDK